MAERRLAAIMFTDIVGYTALMAESEERGRRVRERHVAAVRPLVERYHGEWIEQTGDESLSTFASAVDAVNCALAIQGALRDDDELRVRIGIHQGDVAFEDGRVIGDGVNVAARIRPLAEPGGVAISDEVQHAVQNRENVATRTLGQQELKNVPRPVEVFAVSGTAEAPHSAAQPVLASRGRTVPRAAWAAVALVAIAIGAGWWLYRTSPDMAPIRSIAVLPLENLSGDPEQEYFADGLTEALIGELARIGSLRVISRTSVMGFKGAHGPLPEIAQQLGVQGVLEGSVILEGDRVRVTLQLIDAREDAHLWSERYDRDLGGMLTLQSEIAHAVAAAVRATLTPEERENLQAPEIDPRAFDSYVRGLELIGPDVETSLEAVHAFERAVELDPAFAQAHAQLAQARMLVAGQLLRPPEERAGMMPGAIDAANRALALDERQGIAHAIIGVVRLFQWDFSGAGRSLERAIQLSPGVPEVLSFYNWYLLMVGRLDEAREVAERLRLVAPLDPRMATNVARSFYYSRDYGRALEEYERALALDESVDLFHLTWVYLRLGRMDEAQEAWLEQVGKHARFGLPGRQRMVAASQRGWNEGGMEGAVRAVLEVQTELAAQGLYSPMTIALNYGRLGELDLAFEWLERAYEQHEGALYALRAEPTSDPLRSDPRFQDLLRRIGFPES